MNKLLPLIVFMSVAGLIMLYTLQISNLTAQDYQVLGGFTFGVLIIAIPLFFLMHIMFNEGDYYKERQKEWEERDIN